MPTLENLKKAFVRAPADVVGIDCSRHGLRVVRMKKNGGEFCILGAGLLDAVELTGDQVKPIQLPAKLRGRFAALTASASPDDVKLLRVPESFDPDDAREVLVRMSRNDEEEVRLAVRVLSPGSPKTEARLLAAVMPQKIAAGLLEMMPSAGIPAARTLEIAAIAVMNAFQHDPRIRDNKAARGLIHFDQDYSLIALFNDQQLSQMRLFSFGVYDVLQKICKALNVDQSTAEGVLIDGAFDITHLIEDNFRDVRGQLVICRDFMERSENCALESLHISGPASMTRPFMSGMNATENVTEWNVLEPYPEAAPGAVPEDLSAEPWRMAAAVGACLGVFSAS